jgi:hypothetical protein
LHGATIKIIIMASFSLKEIYNSNSIFTPNGSLYNSSVIPVVFKHFVILKSPPKFHDHFRRPRSWHRKSSVKA